MKKIRKLDPNFVPLRTTHQKGVPLTKPLTVSEAKQVTFGWICKKLIISIENVKKYPAG